MRTVASSYLKRVLRTCIEDGVSEAQLVDLIPGGFRSLEDPLGRLPCAVFYDLLYRSEDVLGETGIGVKVGMSFRPATFLDFGYGMMSCSTLREALAFNRTYQAVNQQLGRASLVEEGNSAFVEWDIPEDAEFARVATETVLTGYVGIGKWITWTHGDEIRSIRFRHAKPSHAELVERAFGCPVFYDEPVDRLEFDKALVDKPMPASNPQLVKRLTQRLDKVLLSIEHSASTHLAVYRLIEQSLAEKVLSIGDVARQLNMSERTLRRRLTNEDRSFRQILADVRRDVCEIYLDEQTRSMVEISQLLGYSEHSAFIRAFRSWFGTTPTEYMSRPQN